MRLRPAAPERPGLAWKIASVLLQYPNKRVYSRLDDAAAALVEVRGPAQSGLVTTLGWLRTEPPEVAARHYVETFDLRRRCSPYLTYYRYGDTRQRGVALLALKQRYRRWGFEWRGSELPDYLPAVLEFAALCPDQGRRLLTEHRAGLELLHLALTELHSPYSAVLDAVRASLPTLSDRQAAEVRRLLAEGPPAEEVGLDPIGTAPFGPPEFRTGTTADPRR